MTKVTGSIDLGPLMRQGALTDRVAPEPDGQRKISDTVIPNFSQSLYGWSVVAMNVHHLELFYHVATHGGVSAAARKMPYGIQQPAISAQIIQLEDSLGTTLFHRRPFSLTKTGRDLYAFIAPFFAGLNELATRLRGTDEVRLRIGAPEIIQRDHLSRVLKTMRMRFPDLTFTLTSARLEEVERRLLEQEIDVGLASLHGKRPEGLKQREMLRVAPVLLVPARSGFTDAAAMLRRDRIDIPLISLPAHEPLVLLFQGELQRRKIDWFTSLEFNSLDVVERYVAEGFGVGLSLEMPGSTRTAGVRVLPLPDFPELGFGAIWLGTPSSVTAAFMDELQALAGQLKPTPPKRRAASARL